MDKETISNLNVIGKPVGKLEAEKRAELRRVAEKCADAEKYAEAAARRLTQLNLELAPFVEQVEAANIGDREIDRMLFDLRRIMEKPNELASHLRQLRAIKWEDISSPPYTEQVDIMKRDALVRRFITALSRFGDIEGHARDSMAQIRQRITMLADAARRDGRPDSFPLLVPSSGVDEAAVD